MSTTAKCVRHSSLLSAKTIPPQFTVEAAIFERFCYKNKNQHKSAKYYQMAMRTRKLVKRLESSQVVAKAKALLDQMGVRNPKSYKPSKDDKLPEASLIADLLIAVANHHTLLKHVVCSTRAGYSSCKVVAAQTYFIPLMLSFMAVFARLHQISLSVMKDLEDSYQSLYSIATKELNAKSVKTATSAAAASSIDFRDLEPMLNTDLHDLFRETGSTDLFDYNTSSTTDMLESIAKDATKEQVLEQLPVETLAPELDMFFSSAAIPTAIPLKSESKKRLAGDLLAEKSDSKLEVEKQAAKKQKKTPQLESPAGKADLKVSKKVEAIVKMKKKATVKGKTNKLSADEIDAIFGL
ncbi:hypothetical protein BDR26DRAFT_1003544 [Obelidium mucronatum]|nr:hypothetical protein BDR26DRAFT_1003544 [Obelidium mucronatum]